MPLDLSRGVGVDPAVSGLVEPSSRGLADSNTRSIPHRMAQLSQILLLDCLQAGNRGACDIPLGHELTDPGVLSHQPATEFSPLLGGSSSQVHALRGRFDAFCGFAEDAFVEPSDGVDVALFSLCYCGIEE